MSKLIVNEIEKYDAGQLTITTGTNVSMGGNLTITGNLAVDTDTLYVDAASNGVGFGTTNLIVGIGNTDTGASVRSVGAIQASRDGNRSLYLNRNTTDGQIISINRDGSEVGAIGAAGSGLTFYTGITERMRIDSSGNVGIGTSSLTAAAGYSTLSVNGTSGGQVAFQTAGTLEGYIYNTSSVLDIGTVSGNDITISAGGTERMRIDSSGNVGIGEQNPQTKLHLTDTSTDFVALRIDNANTSDTGTETSEIRFLHYRSYVAGQNDAGSIIVGKEQAWNASGNRNSFMSFSTRDGASGVSERMRIDSSGNVGIGGAAINSTLAINQASGGARLALKRTNANTTGAVGQIGFQNLNGEYISGIVAYGDGNDNGSHLAFHTTSDAVSTDDNVFELEERMRITSGGDVLFGTQGVPNGTSVYGAGLIPTTNDRVTLRLATSTTGTATEILFYNPNGIVGSIATSGSSTAYNTSSDYRLKENVVEMTGALDRVDALKPSRFNFIADPEKTVDGFLAHEVAEVIPEAISGEKDAVDEEGNPIYQGIDQSKIVPLLVGAIKELSAKVAALESQLNA